MKIAVINNVYSESAAGGAEKVAEKIVNGLKEKGHEVFVVACEVRQNHPQPLPVKEGGIYYLPSIFSELEKYSLWQRFFWHLWDFFNFGHAQSLKNILLKEKPDLVITNNLQGVGFFVPRLLKKLKIKHFHILHDIQLLHPSGLMFWGKEGIINTFYARIYQVIMSLVFGSPEIIISPSEWLLDLHISKGFFKKSETKALPNYFTPRHSSGNVGAHKLDPGLRRDDTMVDVEGGKNKRFLFVGKLEEHKGVKFLIKTFIKFLEKNSQVELLVVGVGSQEDKLEKIAANFPAVKFLGLKSGQEVFELMQQSDCLVVPSLCYENSPTVIYEAFLASLPVLASRLGGIPELFKNGGGRLFEPENEKDLLDKMTMALSGQEEVKNAKNQLAEDYIEILSGLAEKAKK